MLSELSIQLTLFLQSLGDGFRSLMEFFSYLGLEEFYLLVMPLFVWVINYSVGIRLGIMLVLTSSLNFIFKFIFHTPRPYWLNSEIKPYVPENNFGMPSGHSQSPAAIFGLLAANYKRRWLTITVIFFVFMIGFSRIALGMHMIQDVLVGWTIGIIILWAFLKLEAPIVNWFNQQTSVMQYVYALLSGVVFATLGFLVVALAGQFDIPAEWIANANLVAEEGETFNPFTMDGVLTPSGTMSGLLIGYLWLKARNGFNTKGTWWQYILRYILGFIGILLLWKGLGDVLPRSADMIGYLSRFGRYLLIGFWVAGLAPWLFKTVKLAPKT